MGFVVTPSARCCHSLSIDRFIFLKYVSICLLLVHWIFVQKKNKMLKQSLVTGTRAPMNVVKVLELTVTNRGITEITRKKGSE